MESSKCEDFHSGHIDANYAHDTYGLNNSYNFRYKCDFGYRVKGDLAEEVMCIERGDRVEWRDLDGREITMPTCILDMRLIIGLGVGVPLLLLIIIVGLLWRREKRKLRRELRTRSRRLSSIKSIPDGARNTYAGAPSSTNPAFHPGTPPMRPNSDIQSYSDESEIDPYLMPNDTSSIPDMNASPPNAAEIAATPHVRESINSLAGLNTNDDEYAVPADLKAEEDESGDESEGEDDVSVSLPLEVLSHEYIPPPTVEDVAHVPEKTTQHAVNMSSFNPLSAKREAALSVVLADERMDSNNQSEL